MRKFSEDYNAFFNTHKFSKVTVLGYDFQVVDAGSGKQTVVFLNGMDIYHSWIKYVSALENDYRVIMMNYPVEVSKNDEMADLLHALFGKLGIEKPVLCGISDGGVLAQLYAKKYKVGGLIMVSTLTVDSQYVKKNKKEKLVFPLYRKYVEKLKFEKLKSMLITSVQRYFRNETEEEKAYGTSFLECVGSDEKFRCSFIRALKATMDIFSMKHFDKKDFAYLNGKVLVLIPENDMFEKEDYCEKLREIYKEERFDILGGDIVDASRTRHFNPVARNRQYTLNYMRKQILVSWAKCKMFQLIKLFHLKKAIAGHYGVVSDETGRDVKDGSKNLTTREEDGKSVSADSRVDERMKDVLLHGCCLVFSKDFFKQMDGFYDGTFLYAEEEILYYLAGKYGMTLLYAPEIGCMHKEAVSTNFVMQNFCDAKIFYFGNITKSYRAFLALMKKYE